MSTKRQQFAFPPSTSTHNVSRHVQAFADALCADETIAEQQGDASSPAIPSTPIVSASRIRKVSALSDFAPVNLRVKRCADLG